MQELATPAAAATGEIERVLAELQEANERLAIAGVRIQEITGQAERRRMESEAAAAEAATLFRLGCSFSQELDREKLVQLITDEATALCCANFGALFFNGTDLSGDAFLLNPPSGTSKDAFRGFPLPRATPILAPTIKGEGVVRIGDVRNDPRIGECGPQPEGHLPVTSYFAVPVISQSTGVLAGLFFAHREPNHFTEQHERVIVGLAGLAAIALDNARLYESLQKMNRIKDEFLATLSHELRTPLSAILGWAHVLRSGATLPQVEQQRAITAIERNARTQAQLIDDLLDVSRIISGKLQIEVGSIPLEPVIEAAVDTVRLSAAAKGIDLRVAIDSRTSLVVKGDAARLQQVVWNLLANAVKFTPAGGRVDVELRQADGVAVIEVGDTGEGIEATLLPHVFERFWQSDSRPSRRHGGMGLGLAIVRHLCEAHGGTVTAVSDGVDRGARFTVRLAIESVVSQNAPTPSAPPHAEVPVLAGFHILIVDDEADARFLTSKLLAVGGAKVTVVGSAGDALHAMRLHRFDAMVADIGMPGEDGYALIRAVRSLTVEEGAQLPAIAVTAYASVHDRQQALAAGFDDHVAKPISPQELVSAIANLISLRQTRRPVSPSRAAKS